MNLAGLSFRDIEYVVAVADSGSFTAAATHCVVSQPALSMQVRKVEERLGLALFERTGRAVRLTPAGQVVVAQARLVLGEARRLLDLARTLQDPLLGTLRLGAIATLGPYLIPHLLGPVQQRYPDLRLLLREGLTADLIALMHSGDLDAVLLSLPIDDERLTLQPLFFEPFVGICSASSTLAGKKSLRLSEVDDGNLIVMDEGHCIRDQTLALCKVPGGDRERRHVASLETLRHLVAAGAGHAMFPKLSAREDPLLSAHIRYAPFDDPSIGRIVALAWRSTDPRASSLAEFAAFLSQVPIPGVMPAESGAAHGNADAWTDAVTAPT